MVWRLLINLTPHVINLIPVDSKLIAIEPSGIVARCSVQRAHVSDLEVEGTKIPVNRTSFGAVEGLPAPEAGRGFIVSSLVAQAARGRDDLFVVDDTVRDDKGRIMGARALARV